MDGMTSPDAFTCRFVNLRASKDLERLGYDRVESWWLSGDPTHHSPDAMAVTADRATEK